MRLLDRIIQRIALALTEERIKRLFLGEIKIGDITKKGG
jgi:hypothetical protein